MIFAIATLFCLSIINLFLIAVVYCMASNAYNIACKNQQKPDREEWGR